MSSEDPNGLKRRRVARACDTCRRKKVRCDGVQPGTDPPSCTNCKAYGYECAFIDAPKKRGPPKGYIEALETRLQRMESILGGLVQSGDLPEGTISSNLEWINVNESNFRSAQESHGSSGSRLRKSSSYEPGSSLRSGKTNPSYSSKNLMTSLNHHKNGGQSGSDSEELCPNDSNEYSGSHYDLNDSMGQLAIDESGHTRYLGNSSGIFLLRITKRIANGQVITIPKSEWHVPIKRIGPGVMFEFPPKELCDQLLDAYWREIHPFMPFIDKDDLMEKYERLETNYPSIILLYAIFAIAAKYVDDPSVRTDPKDVSTSGYHYFSKARELLKDEFDNATISIVQSLILLALHNQGHKDSITWAYIGLAIRLAQDMGLHRDSSKWNFDERKSEERRRVWWACVVADRFTSAGFGRPLAINEADCDVDYPVAGKIPGDDETAVVGWVETIKCNLILGRILNHIYGIKSKPSQGNVESVLGSLDNELNEWRDNLPKHLHYDSSEASLNDVNTNRKVFLNLLYYTQQILLHRPHIRGPKSKAPPSSIPSLTICTMAANNITHILYRAVKEGALKFSWAYAVYIFFTAASVHIINALSGDDRFREVAKHGLRMTLKCLESMSQHWQAVRKAIFIIRDLLKAKKIELEGITETETSESGDSQVPKIKTPSKKKNDLPGYVKLEDMTTEGTLRDKNLFLNCLPSAVEHPPPKITFAPSPNQPSSPSTDSMDTTNSFRQNQPNQQHHQTNYTESIITAFINQENTANNSETGSPRSSTMRSPTNDPMQCEQTSSPESTTSSSSSPGFMSFTEYLTTDGGLFPTNADAFNPDVTSLIFDNIDDPMGNNNPFLSLPSVIDWNGWTDWTEYMLRMQGLRNPNANVGNMTSTAGPPNVVVGNQNMQNAVTTLMGTTNIPSSMS